MSYPYEGGQLTNPANGAYQACSTTVTGSNTDTPLTFATAVINHLYIANQSSATVYLNPFGSTTVGPLIPIEAGGWRSFDWFGMTPHLLTPAGAVAVNSASAGTGLVIVGGV